MALLLFAIAFALYLIGWTGVTSAIVVGCFFEAAAWVALFTGGRKQSKIP